MKKVLSIIALIFTATFSFAQSQSFASWFTPTSVTNPLANTYRIVGEVTDINNVLNASDVAVGDSLHMLQNGIVYPLVLTTIHSTAGTTLDATFLSVAPFVSTSPSITVIGVCNLARVNNRGYIAEAAGLPEPLAGELRNRFKQNIVSGGTAVTTAAIVIDGVTYPIGSAYSSIDSALNIKVPQSNIDILTPSSLTTLTSFNRTVFSTGNLNTGANLRLPLALSTSVGKSVTVKNVGTHSFGVYRNGTNTIDGSATQFFIPIAPNNTITFVVSATGAWRTIDQSTNPYFKYINDSNLAEAYAEEKSNGLVFSNSTPIASQDIDLPRYATEGDKFSIISTGGEITSLNFPQTFVTLSGTIPTTLRAYESLKWMYSSVLGSWERIEENIITRYETGITPADGATYTVDYKGKTLSHYYVTTAAGPAPTLTLSNTDGIVGGVYIISIKAAPNGCTVSFTSPQWKYQGNDMSALSVAPSSTTVLTIRQINATTSEIVNIYAQPYKQYTQFSNGSFTTLDKSVSWLIVDATATIATAGVQLPTSPDDQQEVTISGGGVIPSGTTVVTAFSFPSTTFLETPPTSIVSGITYKFKYDATISKWRYIQAPSSGGGSSVSTAAITIGTTTYPIGTAYSTIDAALNSENIVRFFAQDQLAITATALPTATSTGRRNVGIGSLALGVNTTGREATAVGYGALGANTTATFNTAYGYFALGDNTTGSENTAMGHNAAWNGTSAFYNSAFGKNALRQNLSGFENAAFGRAALQNVLSNYNTGVGSSAGFQTTTGLNNVFVGRNAGFGNTLGNDNISIGFGSLLNNGANNDNIAIGSNALSDANSLGNNIVIGNNVDVALTNVGNTLNIGNWIKGVSGKIALPSIPTYANDAAADADATLLSGGLYKLTSGRTVYIKP